MALTAYINQCQGVEAAQTTGSPDLCRQQSPWHGIPLHLPHSIPKELQTPASHAFRDLPGDIVLPASLRFFLLIIEVDVVV